MDTARAVGTAAGTAAGTVGATEVVTTVQPLSRAAATATTPPPAAALQGEPAEPATPSESADERELTLQVMSAFNRHIMARLSGATASEWLRLDLSSGQMKLLFWLSSVGEQPMSHVARAVGIGMPAATSVVDRLVEHGLVAREHSPVDRRVVLVRVTDEGQALCSRLRQISEDQWRKILAHVPDDSLAALREGITILRDALQRMAAENGVEPRGLTAC